MMNERNCEMIMFDKAETTNESFMTYGELASAKKGMVFTKFCDFDPDGPDFRWHGIRKLRLSAGNNASLPDFIEWDFGTNPLGFDEIGDWEQCRIRTTLHTQELMTAVTVPGRGIWSKLGCLFDGKCFDNAWYDAEDERDFESVFADAMKYLNARIDLERNAIMFPYGNGMTVLIEFE